MLTVYSLLYDVRSTQKNSTVLGMEISMFTSGGPQIHLKLDTVASNVFEACHFVLKFMQICKNTNNTNKNVIVCSY